MENGDNTVTPRQNWLLMIIIVAVFIRLALVLALPQLPFSDGSYYVERARELAEGLGYQELGRPTAFWPVGYPALLAGGFSLAGPSLWVAVAFNLIGAVMILCLIYWFGCNVAGSKKGALIAAALYAIYPAHIAYTGTILSETTSTAMTMLAMAVLVGGRGRWGMILLAGLLFGLTTLMRAQTLYFPIGVLIAMAILYRDFSLRRAAKAAILLYAGLFTILTPWVVRNQDQLGAPVLVSTNGGVALYTGAFDGATGDHVNWDAEMWNKAGIPFEQRVEREVEADKMLRAKAVQWIKDHPDRYFGMVPKKVILLWSKDSDGFWGLKNTYPQHERALTVMQWVNQIFYMLILLFAAPCLVVGLKGWFSGDEPQRRLLMLFLMPAFVSILAAVFSGQVRYHYGAMPFLLVAAGWTLAMLLQRVTKGKAAPREAVTI